MSTVKRIQCNICGGPRFISYKELDDKGHIKEIRHEVGCLGHENIHPAFWNLHPQHDVYAKFLARKHIETSVTSR